MVVIVSEARELADSPRLAVYRLQSRSTIGPDIYTGRGLVSRDCGSEQVLMPMKPAQRTALLQQRFGTERNSIDISYIRANIGSWDMNYDGYTYDDLPPGLTDVNLDKFSPAPDRIDVIPVLKEILGSTHR